MKKITNAGSFNPTSVATEVKSLDAVVAETIVKNSQNYNGVSYASRLIHNAVDTAPTVDAVPVVRCGECKRWDADPDSYGKDDGPKGKCMKSFEETNDDDFCSYGERKDSVE